MCTNIYKNLLTFKRRDHYIYIFNQSGKKNVMYFKKRIVTHLLLSNTDHKLPKANVNIIHRVTTSGLTFFWNSICTMILIKCLGFSHLKHVIKCRQKNIYLNYIRNQMHTVTEYELSSGLQSDKSSVQIQALSTVWAFKIRM